MSGVVSGGWGFVWAAYTITVVSLIVYGVILVTSLREETSGTSKERPTQ
jgi:heme exporter protein D